jgi:hypothetical protein
MAVDLGSVSKNVPGAGIPMIANQGRVTFRSRGLKPNLTQETVLQEQHFHF